MQVYRYKPIYLSHGQAMVEFIIVIPLLLLLIMGTLQFALIYQAKITLNYAAFEAVRAGSVNNAQPYAMKFAMARSLAPMYTSAPTVANFKAARQRVLNELNDPVGGLAQIDIINPTTDSTFFCDPRDCNSPLGIPNDNLVYRGVPNNADDPNIQDANLLKIQVYYCYEMFVPFVNRIMWAMMRYGPTDVILRTDIPQMDPSEQRGNLQANTFANTCLVTRSNMDNRYFGVPIRAQGIMRMQSDVYRCSLTDTCGV
jgi:hypothetical protein